MSVHCLCVMCRYMSGVFSTVLVIQGYHCVGFLPRNPLSALFGQCLVKSVLYWYIMSLKLWRGLTLCTFE